MKTEILIGNYDIERKCVTNTKICIKIPLFVMRTIHAAAYNRIAVPKTIVLCKESPKITEKYGLYLFRGKAGDLLDVAIIFTKNVPYNMKLYTLAHEIGHCDHYVRNRLNVSTLEEREHYADRIATQLTGLKIEKEANL